MPDVLVRDLDGAAEMSACETLYAGVMGLRPNDGSINPRLMIALQANSGYVLGAFAEGQLVGFAYSFLARERPRGRCYQYSQLAVVDRAHQGHGVGRLLKHAQRQRCLDDGITLMRWAFDPFKARNAYFNLDILGGRLIRLVPSMYGAHGFGTDTGEDTDRFIVDWELGEDVRPAVPFIDAVAQQPGFTIVDGADLLIAIPADWQRYGAAFGRTRTGALRDELRRCFADAFTSGRVGVSCRRVSHDVFAYRFAPVPDVPEVAVQLAASGS